MLFCQFSKSNSLREISTGLRSVTGNLSHLAVKRAHMSGYEVCQKIREKFFPSELLVIMITAKDQLPEIVQGLTLVHQALNPDPHDTCSFPPARRWKNPHYA